MMNTVTDWLIGGGGAVFVLSMIAWFWPKKKHDPRQGEQWREDTDAPRLYLDMTPKPTERPSFPENQERAESEVQAPEPTPPAPPEQTAFKPENWKVVDWDGNTVVRIKKCEIIMDVTDKTGVLIHGYLLKNGDTVPSWETEIAARDTQPTEEIYQCNYCKDKITGISPHRYQDGRGLYYCSYLCNDRHNKPEMFTTCP